MTGDPKREQWASRIGLVLAMAGNAVGLGNFLRFPAQAVKNGGGAFLIPYMVVFLLLGLPLMWIEWTMGRYGGQFGHHSTPGIFDSMGRRRFWKYFGVFGLWSNLIIASYYLYIESWCMAYAGFSLMNGFKKTPPAEFFASLTGEANDSVFAISGFGMIVFFACIALNIGILSRGLSKGIEIVSKIGMPLLILFAAILAVRGLMISPSTDPSAVASPFEGLNFVWEPKFTLENAQGEKTFALLNPSVWLAAAGQIFFTLSIGMGSMHCYASYLRKDDDVTLNGASGAWTNELCEVVLGGSILIPIAVAYLGLAAVQQTVSGGSGFGLGFMVFPTLFNHWGSLAPAAGFLWFGLLFFAAITSSLAMGQPVMAFLQSEFQFTREKSALALAAMLLPLALPVALFSQKSFFDEFDYWGGTFCLVVMAVGEAVLFAWIFGVDKGWTEMMRGADLKVPRFFFWVMKFVTPTLLIVILLASIFEPKIGWDGYVSAVTSGKTVPAWDWSSGSMIGKLLHYDLPLKADATSAEIQFNHSLRVLRTIDRAVLVASFVGFCWLVSIAWKRRKAEGRLMNP
ncbi:sodium-dependent transporter [Schlesneria paludicola]|uniref:sodium-dependent transporter n=1 Tax=Schlesneria paludicola TaxID=360056 RepID=UPI00029A9D48|nr:sodium-dependent transporter [Schlesneria paludicola]